MRKLKSDAHEKPVQSHATLYPMFGRLAVQLSNELCWYNNVIAADNQLVRFSFFPRFDFLLRLLYLCVLIDVNGLSGL